MSTRPILFLDVDGVLNPYMARHAPRSWNRAWSKDTSPSGTRIWVNRQLGAALDALDCDIVWATSWCHHPNDLTWLENAFAIEPKERLVWDATEETNLHNCLKRPAVERYVHGQDRLVVWIDDELGAQDLDFVARRRSLHPIAAYAPKPDRGLDEQTIGSIRAFIHHHTSQA